MAQQPPSEGALSFIKAARWLTYLVYFYVIVAIVFLVLGFLMLLLGASPQADFTQFVYRIAAEFLQPFRGIFPTKEITETSYFSAAGLFAIVMYSFFAAAIHALISWLTAKQMNYENQILAAQKENVRLQK